MLWLIPKIEEKIAESKKKEYKVTSPDGGIYYIKGFIDFYKKYNLTQSAMYAVVKGQRCHHKGWIAELIGG